MGPCMHHKESNETAISQCEHENCLEKKEWHKPILSVEEVSNTLVGAGSNTDGIFPTP